MVSRGAFGIKHLLPNTEAKYFQNHNYHHEIKVIISQCFAYFWNVSQCKNVMLRLLLDDSFALPEHAQTD